MRLLWISIAFLIALAASLFFHRFDPARSWRRKQGVPSKTASPPIAANTSTPPAAATSTYLTPMQRKHGGSPFGRLVVSELKLMLKGLRWWWYVGAAGILIGEVVSPTSAVRGGFLVAAWIWPLLLWSQMGCREQRNATTALLFSSERSITRQFPAIWTAGFLTALLTGSGFAIRLLLSGDLHSFGAWLAGAAFIPSLALALGVWSGSSRAFEALYTVWWYMGPAHQMPGLDFMGTTSASSSPAAYAIAACVLLTLSYLGRRSRMAYV